MPLFRTVLVPLLLGCILSSSGCVWVGYRSSSVSVLPESCDLDSDKNPYPALSLQELNIRLVPHNGHSFGLVGPVVPLVPLWERPSRRPFWIGILFDAQTEGITFDPNKVTLILERGHEVLPTTFTGPFSTEEKKRNEPCTEIFESAAWKVEQVPFYVIGRMCIGVAYNIDPPTQKEKFAVVLDGIEKDRQPVWGSRVECEEGSKWIWGMWPRLGW